LKTTLDLAQILPADDTRRQVFQALRIAVNDELGALGQALPQALDLLEPGGRLVVISFHSLEDAMVKKYFSSWQKDDLVRELTPKPFSPSPDEISRNPRSKSAKLRAISKL
jgi:16S rRNA (cytosine1402-N4)-methyltransferase